MELFTKLESEWMNAVQKKDREALDAMLAPEFGEFAIRTPGLAFGLMQMPDRP
jgi:hypothetical protein